MKMIKMALLGGAALAVSAAGAQADDLTALKAQIESLNSRVAQMEAAPSVPAGYSLLTISEGPQPVVPGLEVLRKDAVAYGDKATVISILPTADAPAATEISWSGLARAAIQYKDTGDQDFTDRNRRGVVIGRGRTDGSDDLDVFARGQLVAVAKTETAVGEIGVKLDLRGNFDGQNNGDFVFFEQAWGYWAMTPELTLGGGFAGSLGNIAYGYDGACSCYYTDNADVGLNPGDTSQMRLSYVSGPLSMAIALEDASGTGNRFSGNGSSADDKLGGAAEIKFAGDTISGEVSGIWRAGSNAPGFEDVYAIGAGIGFGLGDFATITAGAAAGQYNNGQDYWRASVLASANLSDEVHAELAYGHTSDTFAGSDVNAILAGVYYDPVSQLTIGLEGEWFVNGERSEARRNLAGAVVGRRDFDSVDNFSIDLVTIFKF